MWRSAGASAVCHANGRGGDDRLEDIDNEDNVEDDDDDEDDERDEDDENVGERGGGNGEK